MSNYNATTDEYFRYTETRAGDFIVWRGSQQIKRHTDEIAAANHISTLIAERDQANRDAAARHILSADFMQRNQDLTDRTLAWQNWKHQFYNELQHEGRRLHHQSLFLMQANSDSLTYGKHIGDHADDMRKLETANTAYYRITDMSGMVGSAWKSGSRPEWEVALITAEQLMAELSDVAFCIGVR